MRGALQRYFGSRCGTALGTPLRPVVSRCFGAACHTVINDGKPFVLNSARIRTSTENGRERSLKRPLPSLGDMLEYHLAHHPKRSTLDSSDFRLIHWHVANLEFANAAPVNQSSLYNWDQDDEVRGSSFEMQPRKSLKVFFV